MTGTLDTIKPKIRARMPQVIADLRVQARDHHPSGPAREAGYAIHNAAGDEAVVRIYDEIWWLGVNAQDLVGELAEITAPKIRVEINSPGGDVFDGIAIYNALRLHPAQVTTRVDGIAASIASVIAQAGDHRIMVAGSQMMVHNAWGITAGDHADHAETAEILSLQDEIIAGIYASSSGEPADKYRALMEAETWMSAERAVAEGLADEVLQPTKQSPANSTAAPSQRPTLADKITFAVTAVEEATASAEQVSAIRAEAGKTLSGAVCEGLNGLRCAITTIDGLLAPPAARGWSPASVQILADLDDLTV